MRRLFVVFLAMLPLAVYSLGAAPRVNQTLVERQLHAAVLQTLRRNLHSGGLVIYPSPAYYNPYLRDSFWAAQALDDRRFSTYVLREFVDAERRDGDPPTMFVNAYRHPQYHDDESAALVLIWAYRNKTLYGVTPPLAMLQRAVDYLLRRSHDGYLVTPAGPYGGWIDALVLPTADTLAYSQGLYAVALRSAMALRLRIPPRADAQAEHAYRALYNPRRGFVTLSRRLPATDASALTGEFLALWLFHQPILTDAMVASTVRHLTSFGAGFVDVALPPGTDLRRYTVPRLFGSPGDYQNGGSWLLYDALSIGAAGLHGNHDALLQLQSRLALEFHDGVVLREYLRTNPSLSNYGSEPAFRDNFSWDAFAEVVDSVLHDRLGA